MQMTIAYRSNASILSEFGIGKSQFRADKQLLRDELGDWFICQPGEGGMDDSAYKIYKRFRQLFSQTQRKDTAIELLKLELEE